MKRFNYTGRKKILREDIKIRLQGGFCDKPVVDVAISFADYDFPSESSVFLEPQRKTRFMRIALGAAAVSVRRNGVQLSEFDDAEGLDFRVKVVDEAQGLLLGVAENIKPYNKDDQLDDNQLSILPVSSSDLSSYGVLWRVEYSDQKAVLQVERELGSRDQVVRSLMFRGFILPAAMHQILAKILSEDWDEDLSEPEELSTRWLLFARQIGAGLPDKGSEDHEEWIDSAVRILGNSIIGVRQQVIDDFAVEAWK
ncbi:hypothetical protein R0135_14190 [Congregibacter variabilis]|uniref:Uncharacterized protein n=1 Tax=Congregibacter variabilis TaxID=3081200 RepID=A0ABZ0I1J0_9GAMM|nr:hypothetical protein R0135_14190 [Congregibacter sp. IMCC43200]